MNTETTITMEEQAATVIGWAKQLESLSIVGFLILSLAFTWVWVIPKLWKKIEEKDSHIQKLADTLDKVIDAMNSGDIQTQQAVYEETKKLSEKLSEMTTSIVSLESYVKAIISQRERS